MYGTKKYGANMISNYAEIKAKVLQLGNLTDSPTLDMQIQIIINEALAYCYRKNVPICMELPLVDVIVSELNKRSLIVNVDGVTSYREGDMSINFGTTTSNGQTLKYGGKLEPFKQIIGAIKCSDTTYAQ